MSGAPLPLQVCAGCGDQVGAARPTCPGCGTPAGSAQRRVVSLLFADLSGYSSLCASRDPEEVHLLVRPLMNALRRVCEAHGGLVPSIEGDGFMAVFGARVAGEDDPTSALEAAVAMQKLVRSRSELVDDLPSLHVGLHVGEVVVAPSWEDVGVALSGDAVNVARRLCTHAAAGEVLVSADLAPLTRVRQGWGADRVLALRGREEPVAARLFDWADAQDLDVAPRWATQSPYVHRPVLEQSLLALLDEARHVAVVGEAGSGKSRLVREALAGRHVVTVACPDRSRARTRDLLAEAVQLCGGGPVVERLRGLSRDAEQQQDGETEGFLLARGVAALAEPGVVVVLEDAERLPDDELDELDLVLAASPVPWVVVSRTARVLRGVRELVVAGLTPAETTGFVEALLPGASTELRETVVRRAGDSPLYLEQCIRLLVENGAVTVEGTGSRLVSRDLLGEIPTSMRLFVGSRLDLLTPTQHEVLSIASVLGDQPEPALLAFLVGEQADAVEELVERGLLRWVPMAHGAPRLAFAHALVRDVAYERVLRQRRAEVHRAAAEWYAVLPVSQVLEAQAFHLEQSVQLGGADCDLVRRTVDALVVYAKSILSERSRVASDALVRARALAEGRPECGVDLLELELAWAAACASRYDADEAVRAGERVLAVAEERGTDSVLAEAHCLLGTQLGWLEGERAERHLARAEELYRALEDLTGLARVALERAFLASLHDGLAPYVEALDRAYGVAQRSGDERLQARCAQQLALHHAVVTGWAAFEEWAERARSLSRQDDVGFEPRMDLGVGVLCMLGLDPERGLEAARRALGASLELGLDHVHHNAVIVSLDLLLLRGDLAGAAEVLAGGREAFSRRKGRWLDLQTDLLEARLRLRQGDVGASEALLDGVADHELMERRVLRRDLAEARAWCLLERGRFAEAREQATQAVLMDEESREVTTSLRPRLVAVVASCANGERVPLSDVSTLAQLSRGTGFGVVASLMSRWLLVDDLTRGWDVDLHGLPQPVTVEERALDSEIAALSQRDGDGLLDAASTWAQLGTTVWQARALLWHSELTGTAHPEADDLLDVLQAPAGLAEAFRAQVRDLRR